MKLITVMRTMAIKTILEISYIYPGNVLPAFNGSSKKNAHAFARLEWSKLLMIMMLLMIKLVKVMAMSRVTKCTHLRPSGHPILGGTYLRYSSNQNWHP